MDLQDIQATLKVGMSVKLIEGSKEVAQGVISKLFPGELEFTSTSTEDRGFKAEFAYKREWGGWKMLHDDPFTGARCTSRGGPVYLFKPVEQTASNDADLEKAARDPAREYEGVTVNRRSGFQDWLPWI